MDFVRIITLPVSHQGSGYHGTETPTSLNMTQCNLYVHALSPKASGLLRDNIPLVIRLSLNPA